MNKREIIFKPKTVSILIGYQYHNTNQVQVSSTVNNGSPQPSDSREPAQTRDDRRNSTQLPGILIDLYQAYLFALKSCPTEIIVVTDIEQDSKWRETIGAMGKDIVDSGILDFIATLKDRGIYRRHIDKNWLTIKLTQILSDASRVLFYYTGHGKDGYLELPPTLGHNLVPGSKFGITMMTKEEPLEPSELSEDYFDIDIDLKNEPSITLIKDDIEPYSSSLIQPNTEPFLLENMTEFIEMEEIRRICFQQAKSEVEVLFIFDCCNSTGLGLTFNLRPDGVFRLVDRVPRDILSYYPLATYTNSKSTSNRNPRTLEPISKLDEVPIIDEQTNTNTIGQFGEAPSYLNPEIEGRDLIELNSSPIGLRGSSKRLAGEKPKTPPEDNQLSYMENMMNKKRNFFTAKAICISSTAPQQRSLSTTDGSLFTRYLFESLSNGTKSLQEIKKALETGCSSFSQTATIYSTYPDLTFLWKWLYGGEKKHRVTVDLHNGLVIVTPIKLLCES